MDVKEEDVNDILELARKRLIMGRKKYPNKLYKQNIFKEYSEELADCINYNILLYCKVKELERRTLKRLKLKKV